MFKLATQMSLMQMALSSQPNMNVKPAATTRLGKAFEKLLRSMFDGE